MFPSGLRARSAKPSFRWFESNHCHENTTSKMSRELRDYIVKELRFTSHPKYYKYIEEYVSNLTPIQVDY